MRRSTSHLLLSPAQPARPDFAGYATLLWLIAGLFGLRVVGQAIQYWVPHPALPPFEAFQGSGLPYPLLLSVQLVILVWMGRLAWRISARRMRARQHAGRLLAWFGWLYFACMLARLVIGRAFDTGSPWFEAWIPAVFHLVLAVLVLTLAAYHQRMSALRFAQA